MSLKNFQYEAIMRDYNQKQFLHKHEQDEHIRLAEEKVPRLGQIRREIAAFPCKTSLLNLQNSLQMKEFGLLHLAPDG